MRYRLRTTLAAALVVTGTLLLYASINNYPLQNEALEDGVRGATNKDLSKDWGIPEETIKRYLKEAEACNAERLQHIQEVCRRYNLGLYKHSTQSNTIKHPPTPQYAVFYIDKVHKVSWCPIYKAASTTVLFNLLLLGGYSESFLGSTTQQLSELARKVYPELEYSEAEQAFHNTLKFVVVRHPFQRLLSAYRDKLENINTGREHGTAHYYKKYGRRIVTKYRPGGNSTKTWDILTPNQYFWDPTKPKPSGVEPTFREFIRYLMDMDIVLYSDDHWIPYYLYCTPCLLNYDIVAKVETFFRDQVYFIRAANLQDQIKPRWKHKTKAGKSEEEIAQIYFSQLKKSDVLKLYEKYKLDFELFDYKVEDYIQFASEG